MYAEHELKTWPEYFEDIRLGLKTCELRKGATADHARTRG